MSIKTLQRADVKVMQSFVDTMVGIPQFSYPARQNNAPKPADEFAHIRFLNEYPVGIPTQKITAQDELTTTFTTYSATRLLFRIGVVDTTGIPSSKVLHGWTSETMKALMIQSGFGFIKCTPISNETAKLEKEWEARQGFSVEVYATRTYTEVVNNITSMSVSGNFILDNQDSYLMNFDINP
jgi:hypothetical protein